MAEKNAGWWGLAFLWGIERCYSRKVKRFRYLLLEIVGRMGNVGVVASSNILANILIMSYS